MVKSPVEIIDKEMAECRTEIEGHESGIALHQEELKAVQQRLSILADLRKKIAPTTRRQKTPELTANGTTGVLKPSQAVLSLLGRHGRMPGKAIVDALENRIVSKAPNKRRLLFSTLYNLEKSGKVVSDGDQFKLAEGK